MSYIIQAFKILLIIIALAGSVRAQAYLTGYDYEVIQQNYKYYHWAAAQCNIPVEVLIAVHYREANLRRGNYSFTCKVLVKNLGGAFMLDCGGEGTPEFEQNIRYHEKKIAKKYNYSGDTRVSHNFEFACLVAANEIKSKARHGLDTEAGVADAFWGYNGREYGSYLNSAYVSSDPANGRNMTFKFKNKVILDTRPGCLAIWKELKENKIGGFK